MKRLCLCFFLTVICLIVPVNNSAQMEITRESGQRGWKDGYITAEKGIYVTHGDGNKSEISTTTHHNAFTFNNWDGGSIWFYTGPNPGGAVTCRMVINNIGNVGIGTDVPDTLLTLVGIDDPVTLKLDQTGNRAWTGLRLDRNSSEKWFIGMDHLTEQLLFRRNAASNDMILNNSGNLGVGRTPFTYRLEVQGDALKTSGGASWQTSSDLRLKDINGPYRRGLEEILRLKPMAFHYKSGNPRDLPVEEENVGFIAQDVQAVFPEAVSIGPDGYLNFNMHPVNVAVVTAIKELKAENEVLKAENRTLKRDMERIKAILGM